MHRARLGDADAAGAARLLVREIDNPTLADGSPRRGQVSDDLRVAPLSP
jgi:hypothetical protein